jgi:hypothetical protein
VEEEAGRLADAEPGWPGPALLAADLAIGRGDTTAALRRLNALEGAFPEDPAVLRGVATVYLQRSLSSDDRSRLLSAAMRALRRAQALDERDPRVALDLSSAHRLSGDLENALVWAMRSAALEPVPGPAAAVVGALLVDRGRRALDRGEAEAALADAARARAWDPASAGPHLLEGDVWKARRRYDPAFLAYEEARDKEPASREVARALADVRRLRGLAFYAWLLQHPRPRGEDGAPPEAEALSAWERDVAQRRRSAVAELESALRLDPDGEHAASVRESLDALRGSDPGERRAAESEARDAFAEGERLRREGRLVDALERYRAAAERFPDAVPFQMRIAEVSVELGPEHDRDALLALDVLRDLDAEGAYPEADLLRARILFRRWKRDPSPEDAERARRAADRFLAAARARARPEDARNVEAAERILEALGERD